MNDDRGDGFLYDGPEDDDELGAFVWGVLAGVLGAFVALWMLGVRFS